MVKRCLVIIMVCVLTSPGCISQDTDSGHYVDTGTPIEIVANDYFATDEYRYAVIGIPREALEAAAFIAETYYNLETAPEYQGTEFDMNAFREKYGKKEDEGSCMGTSFLSIFLCLAILFISMNRKRGVL